MKRLEDYPRALVIQSFVPDDGMAWLKPFALIKDTYLRELPDYSGTAFGTEITKLMAIKGGVLAVGDTFRTFHPQEFSEKPIDQIQIFGEYLPNAEPL